MSLNQIKREFIWKPHPSQWIILRQPTRFKVIACGRRFGKTTLAVNHLLTQALLTNGGEFWYVAPTYAQAKNIAWRMLVNQYYKLPEILRCNKNESELWIEVGNHSRIWLKGAENEDSLRGSGLDGLIVDEVASMRKWNFLWHDALAPSLTDKRGWAWFIGTPKGFNHFYELFRLEDRDKDFKSFHFTSYDNPFLGSGEIDKFKEILTESSFAQEYLADFRKYTGLIYKEFNRETHCVNDIQLDGFSAYYRAMDFGAVNPTACLFIKVDNDGNFWVYDEYYESGKTTDYHAGQILAKHPQTFFRATFGDPSGRQEIIDYARWNIHITPANKQVLDTLTGKLKDSVDRDWVLYGIELIQQRLKINAVTGRPRLFIHKNCVNLIREFEAYRWEEKREGINDKEIPVKADDHGMDALRYFVVSYQKIPRRVDRQPPEQRHSSHTAY